MESLYLHQTGIVRIQWDNWHAVNVLASFFLSKTSALSTKLEKNGIFPAQTHKYRHKDKNPNLPMDDIQKRFL